MSLRPALSCRRLRASLPAWDACGRCVVIWGLAWSGIVEVHSIHLARKCAYSRRKAETVSTRNLHRRKLIKYAECLLVTAKRDRSQLKREFRDIGCTARSRTIERASLPVNAGILPFERYLRCAEIGGIRALGILSAKRLYQSAAHEEDAAENQRLKTVKYSIHAGTRILLGQLKLGKASGALQLCVILARVGRASFTKCDDTSRRDVVGSCYARIRAYRLTFARQDKMRRRLRADCV